MWWLRRALIAFGCFVAGWLCIGLLAWLVPQLFGSATHLVLALVLGGLIYRDILRRQPPRASGGVGVDARRSDTP